MFFSQVVRLCLPLICGMTELMPLPCEGSFSRSVSS